MTTMYITLSSIEEVRNFVNDVSKMNGDFDLVSGRYVIDAKSIMGIFSLDLTKPLELKFEKLSKVELEVLNKYKA